MVLGISAAALVSLSGCATGRSAPAEAGAAGEPDLWGDWDDLDAAVYVAVGQVEMAILSTEAVSPTERAYELLTIRDEPARLVVRRASPDVAAREPGPISAAAHVGRFGDDRREAALIKALRRRLRDLAGVGVAPVR